MYGVHFPTGADEEPEVEVDVDVEASGNVDASSATVARVRLPAGTLEASDLSIERMMI